MRVIGVLRFTGTEPQLITLTFGTNSLKDEKTLSCYGIKEKSVIHTTIRVQGGFSGRASF